MLEVRKNTFARSYENTFFRDFARELSKRFEEKGFHGLLLGSPYCEVEERLQIDALLITTHAICIIDFKNYSGNVHLPDNDNFNQGLWLDDDGNRVKGGSSVNPFVQVSKQKSRFENIFKRYIAQDILSSDQINIRHTDKIVCFQNAVQLHGEVPPALTNFHITDKVHFAEMILDVIDIKNQTSLSVKSFDAFKEVFLAAEYVFDDKTVEAEPIELEGHSNTVNTTLLRDDQKAALNEIQTFLKDDTQEVFVLQGTLNSGKSFLIPYIQEIAYQSGIEEVECFASSARVANNLLSSIGVDNINSIYSYIYGGSKVKLSESKDEDLNEAIGDDEDTLLEKIPLKTCDNSDNALFIVDEAQLVSDSRYQSIDMVFGSGYLLEDFLNFSDVKGTKRKIIFIGDPYQLQLGNTEESPMNPNYLQEKYSLNVNGMQLLDKEDFSHINYEALKCVHGMKANLYNSLLFSFNDNFSFIARDKILDSVGHMLSQSRNGHILTYTNEDAQKINLWIKTKILQTGNDVSADDLMGFYNNISISNTEDPFVKPQKIYNGEFATVAYVNEKIITESVVPKGKSAVELNFRLMTLKLQSTGDLIEVLSLENFRLNPKAELSDDELVAYKILLNIQIAEFEKSQPFEGSDEEKAMFHSEEYLSLNQEKENLQVELNNGAKVKIRLEQTESGIRKIIKVAKKRYKNMLKLMLLNTPSSKYFQYKHAAFLRYGWAMTVHRSMSYKFDHVILNTDQGDSRGRNNDGYFRWLYSGLSRATKKVELINYSPISPFEKCELKDVPSGVKSKEVFFQSSNDDEKARLQSFEEFFTSKLRLHDLAITNIEHPNWQERYFIRDNLNNSVVMNVSYDGKGSFKPPVVMKSEPSNYGQQVLEKLKEKTPLDKFEFTSNKWREAPYTLLAALLASQGIAIIGIAQNNYHDTMKLFSTTDELEVDIWYGGNGLFSKIIPKFYSNVTIWLQFKKAIEHFLDGDS